MRHLLLGLITLALVLSADCVHARVAPLPLDKLIGAADIIAVVKVAGVSRVEGLKVARGQVVSSLKGTAVGEELSFVAEATWICDSSHAVAGETALIFLTRVPPKRSHPEITSRHLVVAEKLGPNFRLFQITNSGLGRLPVRQMGDRDWIERPYRWGKLPLQSRQVGDEEWVRLEDARRYIKQVTGGDRRL